MEQIQQFKVTLIRTEDNPAVPNLNSFIGIRQDSTDYKALSALIAAGSLIIIGSLLWYSEIYVQHGLSIMPSTYRRSVVSAVASESFDISIMVPILTTTIMYMWLSDPDSVRTATLFGFSSIVRNINRVFVNTGTQLERDTNISANIWAIIIWMISITITLLPIVYYRYVSANEPGVKNRNQVTAVPIMLSLLFPTLLMLTSLVNQKWVHPVFFGGLSVVLLIMGLRYNPYYGLFVLTVVSVLLYTEYIGNQAAKDEATPTDIIVWGTSFVSMVLMILISSYTYYPFYLNVQNYVAPVGRGTVQ